MVSHDATWQPTCGIQMGNDGKGDINSRYSNLIPQEIEESIYQIINAYVLSTLIKDHIVEYITCTYQLGRQLRYYGVYPN